MRKYFFIILLWLIFNPLSTNAYPSNVIPLDTAFSVEFAELDYNMEEPRYEDNHVLYPQTLEKDGWRGILALYPSNLTADIVVTIEELNYENATLLLFARWIVVEEMVDEYGESSGTLSRMSEYPIFNQSVENKNTYLTSINKQAPGGKTNDIYTFSYDGFDNGTWTPSNQDFIVYGYNSIVAYIQLPENETWNHSAEISIQYKGTQDLKFYNYLMQRAGDSLYEDRNIISFQFSSILGWLTGPLLLYSIFIIIRNKKAGNNQI